MRWVGQRALHELQDAHDIAGDETADGSRRVDGLGDLASGADHEARRVQETAFALYEGTGELVDLVGRRRCGGSGSRRGASRRPAPGSSSLSSTDRATTLRVELVEKRCDGVEVNQLLTTVRSPVAPVDEHDAPRSFEDIGNRHVVAVEILRRERRKDVASFQLHPRTPSGSPDRTALVDASIAPVHTTCWRGKTTSDRSCIPIRVIRSPTGLGLSAMRAIAADSVAVVVARRRDRVSLPGQHGTIRYERCGCHGASRGHRALR